MLHLLHAHSTEACGRFRGTNTSYRARVSGLDALHSAEAHSESLRLGRSALGRSTPRESQAWTLSTRKLHTAQGQHQQRAQHPDTQRQVARNTPIYLFPAREASFPFRTRVRLPQGELPDPYEGLAPSLALWAELDSPFTMIGLTLIRARHIFLGPV